MSAEENNKLCNILFSLSTIILDKLSVTYIGFGTDAEGEESVGCKVEHFNLCFFNIVTEFYFCNRVIIFNNRNNYFVIFIKLTTYF